MPPPPPRKLILNSRVRLSLFPPPPEPFPLILSQYPPFPAPVPSKLTQTRKQTITAPLAAFTMALVLFVYARSSIAAARRERDVRRGRSRAGGREGRIVERAGTLIGEEGREKEREEGRESR
ncbi:MAG: hypothetical protein M1830_004773 [Pleopsidium flavum]|nr:MAG: hypothetical protein M1830_004773 [Pleopsidium flavum]